MSEKKKKAPIGNRTSLNAQKKTKRRKNLFIGLYPKNLCHISNTCQSVGIHRRTYYLWIEKDEEFKLRCEDAEEGLIDTAEAQLFKNIKRGKEVSLIFFLKNKRAERWRDKHNIEHSGSLTLPLLIDKLVNEKEEKKNET